MFISNKKPRISDRPYLDRITHDLNEHYALAELIITGLEGFHPDPAPVQRFNPIDYRVRIIDIIVSGTDVDEFYNVIEEWFNTGGREISEEFTRQFLEWRDQ